MVVETRRVEPNGTDSDDIETILCVFVCLLVVLARFVRRLFQLGLVLLNHRCCPPLSQPPYLRRPFDLCFVNRSWRAREPLCIRSPMTTLFQPSAWRTSCATVVLSRDRANLFCHLLSLLWRTNHRLRHSRLLFCAVPASPSHSSSAGGEFALRAAGGTRRASPPGSRQRLRRVSGPSKQTWIEWPSLPSRLVTGGGGCCIFIGFARRTAGTRRLVRPDRGIVWVGCSCRCHPR